MAIGVYILLFGSGRFYIGSSKHISNRIEQHRKQLIDRTHVNCLVQEEWDTYQQFDLYEYHTDDREIAYTLEQSFLDIHCNNPFTLNISTTAKGGAKISRHPDRALIIDKIRIATIKSKTYCGKQEPIEKKRKRSRRRKRRSRRKFRSRYRL